MCTLVTSDHLMSYRVRHRSDEGCCVAKRTVKSIEIAPGCTYASSTETVIDAADYDILKLPNVMSVYEVSVVEMRTSLGKWIVRLRRYQPGDSMSVEVKWTAGGVPSKAERGAVLSVFYCRFYGPERMDCFLNRGFHNLLSCFRRPVYDQKSLINLESVFMVKVDRESTWCLLWLCVCDVKA